MKTIPCPLCGSSKRRLVWYQESYPAFGGKVVPLEKAESIPWLPLEVSVCLDCYHIYESQVPEPELLKSFYTGVYTSSNPSPVMGGPLPKGLEAFFRMIQEAVGARRGRALEIGAYDGYFLHLLEQDGWSTTGFEPAEIGDIGKKTFNLNIRREFYQPGNREESWNLVVSRYVFEHLPSPREMLDGIFDEMALGGWLALEVPDMQTRLREGILGCFAHEHLSYFVPITLHGLVEETGFEVKHSVNSADGLSIVAQKPTRPSLRKKRIFSSEVQHLNQELIDQFCKRRTQKREKFTRELSSWSGPDNFVVYGADSHTTDLLVERWLPAEKVSWIIDDDPAKQGCVAAGFSIPIVSRARLPEPGQALIVLSSFRNHDQMWENLLDWRSHGGAVMRFYPECLLMQP